MPTSGRIPRLGSLALGVGNEPGVRVRHRDPADLVHVIRQIDQVRRRLDSISRTIQSLEVGDLYALHHECEMERTERARSPHGRTVAAREHHTL